MYPEKHRKEIILSMIDDLTPSFIKINSSDYPDDNVSFIGWFNAKYDSLNPIQKYTFDKEFKEKFPITNEKIELTKNKMATLNRMPRKEARVFTIKYHMIHIYKTEANYIKKQKKYTNLSIEEIIEANMREEFLLIKTDGLRINDLASSYKANKNHKPSKIIKIENLDTIN